MVETPLHQAAIILTTETAGYLIKSQLYHITKWTKIKFGFFPNDRVLTGGWALINKITIVRHLGYWIC